jgi:PHD/YefM family antitoxin component YafN of YafNO toxin-antitoxin module
MANMSISQAREQLPTVIELCQTEAVILERYGKPQAVIISYERYDELMTALEDIEDLEAIAEIEADIEKNGTIPWEEVRRDLGIE